MLPLKIVTFLSTFILILTISLVISLNHAFVIFEYHRSSFPPDPYGLSVIERTQLGLTSLAFLTDWHTVTKSSHLLTDLTFAQTNKPVYSTAEIDHLSDVKKYTDLFRVVLIITLTLFISLIFHFSRQRHSLNTMLNSIRLASLSMIAIISLKGILIILFWEQFFLIFHQLLFPQGNWTFSVSSSLIRLFPEIFWVDYAIFLIGIMLILSLIIILTTTYLLHLRSERLTPTS